MKNNFKEWIFANELINEFYYAKLPEVLVKIKELRSNLEDLTNKAKYDLVHYFKKLLQSDISEISQVEKPIIKIEDLKSFLRSPGKTNEEKKQKLLFIYQKIGNSLRFDTSKNEEFKQKDIQHYKDKAKRNVTELFGLDKELLDFMNKKSEKGDFDLLAISVRFVNPFSYLRKDTTWKLEQFKNKSDKEFLDILRGFSRKTQNSLERDEYRKQERETAGLVNNRGNSVVDSIATDDRTASGSSRDQTQINRNQFSQEIKEAKKIINDYIIQNPLEGVLFCKMQRINCENLSNNNDLFIYEKIKKPSYDSFLEYLFGMTKSINNSEKQKAIDFVKKHFQGDDEGNPGQYITKNDMKQRLEMLMKRIKQELIPKIRQISNDSKWGAFINKVLKD